MIRIALPLILAVLAASPARANEPDARFAGAWRISGAVLAPWATSEQGFPEVVRALTGKAVHFAAGGVSAPRPLACTGPAYRVRSDAPAMLFQGGLADLGDPPPAQRARSLGVTLPRVATLEVGCSEIEYHLARPGVLLFALDNQIFTMRRPSHRPRQ